MQSCTSFWWTYFTFLSFFERKSSISSYERAAKCAHFLVYWHSFHKLDCLSSFSDLISVTFMYLTLFHFLKWISSRRGRCGNEKDVYPTIHCLEREIHFKKGFRQSTSRIREWILEILLPFKPLLQGSRRHNKQYRLVLVYPFLSSLFFYTTSHPIFMWLLSWRRWYMFNSSTIIWLVILKRDWSIHFVFK